MKVATTKTYSQRQLVVEVATVVRSGGLCVIPSDTVYGLVCDATNAEAVSKLLRFKRRPVGKPISVFVRDIEHIKELVQLDRSQEKMVRHLTPGPYTLILDYKSGIDNRIISESHTLGVRLPDYSFVQDLMTTVATPVTATSANISGRGPHYSVESLLGTLSASKLGFLDFVVDVGKLKRRKPSTVLDLTAQQLKVLRRGEFADLRDICNESVFQSKTVRQTREIARAILKKHKSVLKTKALAILLEGELGVGKTVFVKAIGEALGVNNIISPTFVILYEYEVGRESVDMLYHFDLFRLCEKSEFEHLGMQDVFKKGNIVCIEWGEKSGEILELLQNTCRIVYVKMKYKGYRAREIVVNQLNT